MRVYFPLVCISEYFEVIIGRFLPIQYIDGIKNLYQKDLDITYDFFVINNNKTYQTNFVENSILYEFSQYKRVIKLLDNYYSNNNLLDNVYDELFNGEIEFFKKIYNKFSNKLDYDYVFMSCFEHHLVIYMYIILLLNKYNSNIKIVIGGPITLSDNINKFLLELSNNIFIRPGDLENVIIELFNNNLEEERIKLEYFNFSDYPDYMPIYNQDSLNIIKSINNNINYRDFDRDNNIEIFLNFSRGCRYQCEFCICTGYPAGFSHLSGDKIEYLLNYYKKNNFTYLSFSDNSILNYKDDFINHFNTDLKLSVYADFTRFDNNIYNKVKQLNIDLLRIDVNTINSEILHDKYISPDKIIEIIYDLINIKQRTHISFLCNVFEYSIIDIRNELDFLIFVKKMVTNTSVSIDDVNKLYVLVKSIIYNNLNKYNLIFEYIDSKLISKNIPDNIREKLLRIPIEVKSLTNSLNNWDIYKNYLKLFQRN